jgi:hypothetical protein
MKTVDDIVTQPSAPSARQAVSRADRTQQVRASPAPAPPLEAAGARGSTSRLIASAHRAVRRAASAAEVRAAAAEVAHAVYDSRISGMPRAEVRALVAGQRSVESKANAKLQSLSREGQDVRPVDGTVFETRVRWDGKTEHFANEPGSMREQHVHVVEGDDSSEEHTTYDYVRDADGNVYIDRRQ